MNVENKLSYDDITIVPEAFTTILSRKECDPYINDMLPIFTAPMDTVVNEFNYQLFLENRINPVIPRTVDYDTRIKLFNEGKVFVAFSIKESLSLNLGPIYNIPTDKQYKLCIDLANGHMTSLLALVKDFKTKYNNNIIIMTGNIANPNAYKLYDDVGVDFCRCGIGGGEGCLTSSNLGIHYPYFSLLKEIYDIKNSIHGKCKVIADGNIRGYCDIQKALINADYVMIGGLLNRCIESAAPAIYGLSYFKFKYFKIINPFKTLFTYGRIINPNKYKKVAKQFKNGIIDIWKPFYGMSTKVAQAKMGNTTLKTSEGIIKRNKVKYSLSSWVENETDYLRSAMSYTDSRTLKEYKEASWVKINMLRFNK